MILEELDGRRAHQWVTSIVAYLHWRSGAEWRPLSDRWNPERMDYLRAAYLVKQAFSCPSPSTTSSESLTEPFPRIAPQGAGQQARAGKPDKPAPSFSRRRA
jgi:hypothetical protein